MNDKDPLNPQNTEPTTETTPPEAPEPNRQLPVRPHKKKLFMYVALLVLLLVGGSVTAWAILHKAPSKVTPVHTAAKKSQASTKPVPHFYLTSGVSSVSVYNLATSTQSSISLDTGKDTLPVGGSLYQNRPLQVSTDGKVIAYTLGDAVDCGEGGCNVSNLGIFVKSGDETQKVASLTDDQDLGDWLLNPNGQAIYYLVHKRSSASPVDDLHMVTIASKKDVLIKSGIAPKSSYNRATAMLPVGNDAFRFYDAGPGAPGLVEYSFHDGQLTSRDLVVNSFCANCDVSYPSPLSPDGTMLALRAYAASDALSYYVLNLENGTHQQNATGLKSTEQANQFYWSPDGKYLAYAVSDYGGEGQNEIGLKFRLEIFDIATGKTTTGFSDTSPGIKDPAYNDHVVNLLGWSPDGKYLAFAHSGTLNLYAIADATSKDTEVAAKNITSSDTGFGWYEQ